MMTIWKYSLKIVDEQVIEMPKRATPLTVQMQHGEPAIWVLVDDKMSLKPRTFRIFGTGHEITMKPGEKLSYIATFQQMEGVLVWHLFEVGKP